MKDIAAHLHNAIINGEVSKVKALLDVGVSADTEHDSQRF